MITMTQFVNRYGITMDVERVDQNPNLADDDKWANSASHYRCTLKRGKKRMTIYYSMGAAHSREPTIDEVVDTIAAEYTTETFEGFCSEFGYDTDSRQAERIYKACVKNSKRMDKFFGEPILNALLRIRRE